MSSPNERSRPIKPGRLWYTRSHSLTNSDIPVAEAAIAKDLEDESDSDPENAIEEEHSPDESDSDDSTVRQGASKNSSHVALVGSYRRLSFIAAAGPRPTAVDGSPASKRILTKAERHEVRKEERSLLRDNHLIPPKHPRNGEGSKNFIQKLACLMGSASSHRDDNKRVSANLDQQVGSDGGASESTRLLGDPELPYGGQDTPGNLHKRWEEAVMAGQIQTTWQRESKVLFRFASPLVLTFLLQYSLTTASIFSVGHLGKVELGAVSLGCMTANITGYAIYQGLATSLDTLCAQAYGSGRKKLVGLQTQRMVCSSTIFLIHIFNLTRIILGLLPLAYDHTNRNYVAQRRSYSPENSS